jgi:hypothetical protein
MNYWSLSALRLGAGSMKRLRPDWQKITSVSCSAKRRRTSLWMPKWQNCDKTSKTEKRIRSSLKPTTCVMRVSCVCHACVDLKRKLISCSAKFSHVSRRVARWFVFKPEIQIWVNFGGSNIWRFWYILWTFGPFYSVLVHFMDILYNLWWFSIFFPRFGILYQEKSGNPG